MGAAREYPRVLFVTPAAFNRTTGGGITFGNLFAGWPKNRLATAHNDPIPTTTETCERYYRLGPREIRRWGPLERVAPAAGSSSAENGSAQSPRFGFLKAAKNIVFGQQLPDGGTLSPEVERWIAEFRPEVLYTILGTNGMMELVDAIQRRFSLPLVIHMMDDWPESSYRGGALGFLSRRRMTGLLRNLMRQAAVRFGICDAMCAAYEGRYGASFISFQNTIDHARWAAFAKTGLTVGSPAELVYVGSILPVAQLESLAECCQAVAKMEDVRLSIYSPSVYAEAHRHRLVVAPNIALRDTITDDDAFFRRLASADALLLPVNFDPEAVRLLRYSMPTKVPAYLLSGTPILAYGPDSVAQIRYALDGDWAHVVSERGTGVIAKGLRRILTDTRLRARLSWNARSLARERHDTSTVRLGFQQALIAAARGEAAPIPR
jgi:glycosyltransferase involved in cell wall biosynthesis